MAEGEGRGTESSFSVLSQLVVVRFSSHCIMGLSPSKRLCYPPIESETTI